MHYDFYLQDSTCTMYIYNSISLQLYFCLYVDLINLCWFYCKNWGRGSIHNLLFSDSIHRLICFGSPFAVGDLSSSFNPYNSCYFTECWKMAGAIIAFLYSGYDSPGGVIKVIYLFPREIIKSPIGLHWSSSMLGCVMMYTTHYASIPRRTWVDLKDGQCIQIYHQC